MKNYYLKRILNWEIRNFVNYENEKVRGKNLPREHKLRTKFRALRSKNRNRQLLKFFGKKVKQRIR